MDSAHSSEDYARSYEVYTSLDGEHWGEPVASGEAQGAVVTAAFPLQTIRYIKVVQTGVDSHWWSVAELKLYTADNSLWIPEEDDALLPAELDRTHWTVTASTYGDDTAMLDDDLNSRWTSSTGQSAGQWIQLDLGRVQSFSRLSMDSGSSSDDYARGFQILTSEDGEHWKSIADNQGTGATIMESFPRQTVRYVKIVLTTDTPAWWWSIAELKLYH